MRDKVDSVLELECVVQSYDWGKVGSASKVAQLAQSGSASSFSLDETKPYAELWMGSHPNGPSKVRELDAPLPEYLRTHGERVLGKDVYAAFEKDLPFLFKVLSIQKALSIQAHPNKDLAKTLHATAPSVYKDANHKPEMAVALTRFEALVGFRPLSEIQQFLKDVPELSRLVRLESEEVRKLVDIDASSATAEQRRDAIHATFRNLMEATPNDVSRELRALVQRVEADASSLSVEMKLVLRLNEQFPDDVGCFCVFFLNYLELDPGQAIFLQANLPHAYLSGDCVEVMATSDNVVRAGLTPKLRDVKTLVDMLDYADIPAAKMTLEPARLSEYTRLYKPAVQEFALRSTKLNKGEEETFPAVNGPSVLLVADGEGEMRLAEDKRSEMKLSSGKVYFIAQGQSFTVKKSSGSSALQLFTAFCEI